MDRKVLAQLAVSEPSAFVELTNVGTINRVNATTLTVSSGTLVNEPTGVLSMNPIARGLRRSIGNECPRKPHRVRLPWIR